MARSRPPSRITRQRSPPGSAPGTLIPDPAAASSHVRIVGYGPADLHESAEASVDALEDLRSRLPVVWVDVQGLGDVALVTRIGEMFDLHRLALEDVLNSHQRPKVETYGAHLFIVARMPTGAGDGDCEQLSVFLGDGYVLTFHEHPTPLFEAVMTRVREGRGRLRRAGADYLAYALLDAAVDAFFPVLERVGERLESVEGTVIARPDVDLVPRIHDLKRDLLALRRAVWPMRELFNGLVRDETEVVSDQTRVYLRDCYDHTVQLIDVIETYREIASGLVDVHLSSVSARLNEVMKVLTVISTIFMPLSFITGLYGMNFDRSASRWNMPELGWPFGYPLALLLMAVVALVMLAWFRRLGWMGGAVRPGGDEEASRPR
jgi:magnesium transporter